MRVKPSQIVPGCVLLQDVFSKTSKPIISKQTVLTDEHITILQKFFIDTVEVASTLANGAPFQPDQPQLHEVMSIVGQSQLPDSFIAHYQTVVANYKQLFQNWQSTFVLNMADVRMTMLPLLEQVDSVGDCIYTLHHYADERDYRFHHSVAVGLLAAYVAKRLGYKKGEWLQVGLAGLLSDAGMVRIAASTLEKSGTLSQVEWEEVKKHPIYSYRLIEKSPTATKSVKLAVLQHHERLDGSGYPLGISHEKIHAYARIIAVCDTYHAMTSVRPYKQKQSTFHAVGELQNNRFTMFDHEVVQVLIDDLTRITVGTKVKLSTNQIGEVVFTDKNDPTRPIIRLDGSNEMIALKDNEDIQIETVL
ncbi:HD-GYP domain-containing protein [Lentibacillus cibarius]|uniref:HD-GYP domain-containing protein n=1 Tax=Lentibacillus cibarius TaxID=2583219 RepID=A0A5S3QK28_9BACI|nr:HD-GYP domain-containing protein [Lentibacillus cibarius]TMN22284.1 HD-GYP domain-containing protein [Lentibacillus cibarius]